MDDGVTDALKNDHKKPKYNPHLRPWPLLSHVKNHQYKEFFYFRILVIVTNLFRFDFAFSMKYYLNPKQNQNKNQS